MSEGADPRDAIDLAECVAEVVRKFLIAAAHDGRMTGSLTVNLKNGAAGAVEVRIVTGGRDGWVLPTLPGRSAPASP